MNIWGITLKFMQTLEDDEAKKSFKFSKIPISISVLVYSLNGIAELYMKKLRATDITAMILLRTVLNREIWFDPLGKIFGGWGLYEEGQFTTESIENFMLFVPFSILLLWTFQKELLDESENIRFGKTVWEATKVVAVFSFLIEFTQLLFHLGTFQISDLVYNTLGGAVGGVIYYLGYCRKRKNKMRNRGQLSEH